MKSNHQALGWVGDVDWINQEQDRDRWLAPVNIARNLHFP
jgi:hypothetical protein